MKRFVYIVYEQWQSMRKLYAIAVAAAVATPLGTYLFGNQPSYAARGDFESAAGVATGGIHAAHVLWLLFLLLASGDDDDLRLTMPRHLLRLPVSAVQLVGARMTFGLLSTVLLAVAGTGTFYALFDVNMERYLPWETFVTIYPTLYAALQATAWCIGPAGITPTIAVAGAGYIALNGLLFDFRFAPFDPTAYSLAGIAATVVFSFVAAALVVGQHRKSRFSLLEFLPSFLPGSQSRIADTPHRFSSPKEALRWYEHRRQWRMFPGVSAVFFPAFLALYSLMSPRLPDTYWYSAPIEHIYAHYAERFLVASSSTLAMATLLTGAAFLFRGWRPLLTKERSFLFTRPVDIKMMTEARCAAGARSILIGAVPLLVVMLIAFFFDLRPGPYDPESGQPTWDSTIGHLTTRFPVTLVVGMTLSTVVGVLAAVWACLWFENVVAISGVFALVALMVELVPASRAMEPIDRTNFEFRVTAVIVLVAFAALAAAVIRRRMLNVRRVCFLAAILPLAGVGAFLYANASPLLEQTPLDWVLLTTVIPLYLMAVTAPILSAPLITFRARHRK